MSEIRELIVSLFILAACATPAFSMDCSRNNCDWAAASAYCRGNGARLPTPKELLKAWDGKCKGKSSSGVCGGWYWSSREKDDASAWGVSFRNGAAAAYDKTRTTLVHCVKNGAAASGAARPAVKPAKNNRAISSRCSSERCTWPEAYAYCRSMGSRLYNFKEFEVLCSKECGGRTPPESCSRWYWLNEPLDESMGEAVICRQAVAANGRITVLPELAGTPKSSLSYARCPRW